MRGDFFDQKINLVPVLLNCGNQNLQHEKNIRSIKRCSDPCICNTTRRRGKNSGGDLKNA